MPGLMHWMKQFPADPNERDFTANPVSTEEANACAARLNERCYGGKPAGQWWTEQMDNAITTMIEKMDARDAYFESLGLVNPPYPDDNRAQEWVDDEDDPDAEFEEG